MRPRAGQKKQTEEGARPTAPRPVPPTFLPLLREPPIVRCPHAARVRCRRAASNTVMTAERGRQARRFLFILTVILDGYFTEELFFKD